jgi:hypothetical protein
VCGSCNKKRWNEKHNAQHIVHNRPTKRLKKWSQIGHTQRNTRKRKVMDIIDYYDVPLEQLKKQRHQPENVIHLSTTDRKLINREDKSMPAEKNVNKCKINVATTHGTETRNFFF